MLLPIALLLAVSGPAPASGPPSVVTVEVSDVASDEGHVVAMLFADADGFPREPAKAFRTERVAAVPGTLTITLADVPPGDYALAVFHDADDDGEVATNFIGIPQERVGAANVSGIGRPSFAKSTVTVDEPAEHFTLTFIN